MEAEVPAPGAVEVAAPGAVEVPAQAVEVEAAEAGTPGA